jgi:hypothetical protein
MLKCICVLVNYNTITPGRPLCQWENCSPDFFAFPATSDLYSSAEFSNKPSAEFHLHRGFSPVGLRAYASANRFSGLTPSQRRPGSSFLKSRTGELKNFSRVDLRIGEGDNPPVTAPLREDRSKPGRVVVNSTADRAQLDKLKLWMMVPGSRGGTIYDLRVKDFVEPKKDR